MIEPIDVVMTCWKRERMTSSSIYALKLNTQTPIRLILIDNGSNPVYTQQFARQADIYVKLDKNYGLEYTKNLGMQFVTSKLFVSTDNDILIYKYENPDWLQRIINLLDTHAEYGAIAPRPQVLIGTGNIFAGKEDQELIEFGHVPGYMRVMRTEWVKSLGAWNEKRALRGHEELWIGEKFSDHHYKMGWATNVKCWHLFGEDDTDAWGYPKNMTPQDHGHNPVAGIPKNDVDEIRDKVGITI